MDITNLIELGFSADEAKVYVALLELGGSYVSAIAKKSGVHRVVCYKILESLTEKGFASQFDRNNIRHFSAEDPRILIRTQQQKLLHAEKMLPELLSLTHALAYKPKVQYYEGVQGMKNVLEDTLNAEGEIIGYTDFAALPTVLPENELIHYAQQKLEKRIRTRFLSPHSNEGLRHLGYCYPQGFHTYLVEVLFIDPKSAPFGYQITFYNDRAAILSLNPKELLGMIIESAVYTNTERAVFDLAWKGALAEKKHLSEQGSGMGTFTGRQPPDKS